MMGFLTLLFKRGLLQEAAVLSVSAAVLALAVNHFSPRGIAFLGQWDVKKGVVDARAREDAAFRIPEVVLPEASALFEKGVLFVDARDPEEYAAGHIRKAVSLCVREFWEKIGDFENRYPADTPLIVYCSGRECPDSRDLAENLVQAGYTDVTIFADGFPLWQSEGLPVEK